MSQLIHMRQRIKAVETIKKITHAMRLISMSTHSRLRHKKVYLENYKSAFQILWTKVKHATEKIPQEENIPTSSKHLIILVGSQKGLCGAFNTLLFKFFELEQPSFDENYHIITVGKHATDYIKHQEKTILASYDNFNATSFISIAHAITSLILNINYRYNTVTLYSNHLKSFFVQKPHKSSLLPLKDISVKQSVHSTPSEYIFEQSPQELSIIIKRLMLVVTIQELLFESLLAEQAARFLSMDASTRNADNLLNEMRLEYNKTRQAAITRELTELASSY